MRSAVAMNQLFASSVGAISSSVCENSEVVTNYLDDALAPEDQQRFIFSI